MERWLLTLSLVLVAQVVQGIARADAATLGKITVRPPAPWKRVPATVTERTGQTALWNAPGGKELYLNFWPGLPPRPGGPMVVAETFKVTVAGEKVELIRASAFNGVNTEVWVVFLQRGAARYRLWARRTTRAGFEAVLRSITFTE